MKFKIVNMLGNNRYIISSTRNITLLNSPEFGHILVDAKIVDSKVIDSGRMKINIDVAPDHTNVGHFGVMAPDRGDYKILPGFYITRAELMLHDTNLGTYVCGPVPRLQVHDTQMYSYNLSVPEAFRNDASILEPMIVTLLRGINTLRT